MRNDKQNLIVGLTKEFALEIISYTEILEQNRKYNMAHQLFRSGTSIGAHVPETQNAESKPGFIHKLKNAARECDETHYWRSLCMQAKSCPSPERLLTQTESINKVLSKIIATSKRGTTSNRQILKSSNQ